MEIIGLKAPGNYSGSFWSYNFSICLWESPKTLISMISGLLDVSLSPNTNIIYLLRPRDTSRNLRKYQIIFKHVVVGKFEIVEIQMFENYGKDGRQQIPTNVHENLENPGYQINIYQKI